MRVYIICNLYIYICIDFYKKLQNITDNRQYRKTVVDLKNIQSMLLRYENLNCSKIQNSAPGIENSPADIYTDSSSSGSASSNFSLNGESEFFSTQDKEPLEILE